MPGRSRRAGDRRPTMVVVRAQWLIDGIADKPRHNMEVVIRGNRILEVRPANSQALPADGASDRFGCCDAAAGAHRHAHAHLPAGRGSGGRRLRRAIAEIPGLLSRGARRRCRLAAHSSRASPAFATWRPRARDTAMSASSKRSTKDSFPAPACGCRPYRFHRPAAIPSRVMRRRSPSPRDHS